MSCKELRTSMNHPLILALPHEVTSAIFEICYPPLPPASDPNVVLATELHRAIADQLVLGAVCGAWRDIAWKTPRLWTVLAVPSNSNSSWHPLIRKWLERSGKLPLSISVYRHHRLLGKDHLAEPYALINILNEHSDRWQTLQLLGLPTKLLYLFHGREDSTSVLRTLTITRCFDEKCTFFMRNASPVSISLTDFSFDLFGVSWYNLTCGRVEISTFEDCLRLLKDAPKLQIFQLDLMTDNDENETTPEQESPIRKMVHGRLKELYLTAFDKVSLEKFLGFPGLTLPALQKLTIYDAETDIPLKSFLSLFRRSSCSLKELTIIGTTRKNDPIINFLQNIPSLKELKLQPFAYSGFHPGALFTFIRDTAPIATYSGETNEERATFLPRLQSFLYEVDKDDADYFPWHLIADTFGPLSELQDPRRRPLNCIAISFEGDMPPVVDPVCLSSLLRVIDAGLDLSLKILRDSLDLIAHARRMLD